jgi:hypothetical protein
MARFNTNTFRSLNESISRIQNPIAALDEAMEYTSILETVILDLCEALDLDPQALLESVISESYTSRRRYGITRTPEQRKRDALAAKKYLANKPEYEWKTVEGRRELGPKKTEVK